MSVAPSDDVSQSSGTAVALQSPASANDLTERVSSNPAGPAAGEEQALESHEVIELQTFSERKVWIEEKIKFLEKMPAIEVFAGLDAVRASAEHVPGLPTPEELKQWVAEHDAIEKETEIFDRGELTKLRQLTKAATQRNLSPADTDVIELTLTAIYELDKLLHLLRHRSENLELLGVRLTWEESRIAAWVDRRKILEDLQAFLDTRARWSPSVYESPPKTEDTHDPKRRASVTSFASAASDTSTASAGISRSIRFKLAELLSRDAAQFAGRITSLRHGKITAAGKVLDKLIDNSRKPVPEELLDEQDRLEEKGITELEHAGKFVMNIVMQWRKADEIYVETMKDKATAQNLFEEIETAKLHHPSARQSASFVSRADALTKRLALRGNPASPSSSFPCPEHPLFGEQKDFNKMLVQSLSSEIASVASIARNVDAAAKAYRVGFEAVKRVENLTATTRELSTTFDSIISRLREGVSAGDGDGSPPNLMTEECLDPSRHSAFLALLPSILKETEQAAETSSQVLRQSLPALLDLDHPGIDAEFKADAGAQFERLESLLKQAQAACDDVTGRGNRLREARRISGLMDAEQKRLEDIRQTIAETMEAKRWRQVSGSAKELLTPESQPASPLPTEMSQAELADELLRPGARIVQEIDAPLATLGETLEDPLKQWLLQKTCGLKVLLEGAKKMAELLQSIQRQADVMKTVYNEFNDIQLHIEDARVQMEARTDDVLRDRLANGNVPEVEADLRSALERVQSEVAMYVNGLADRVLFVSPHADDTVISPTFHKRHGSVVDARLGRSTSVELPFDLAVLDEAVRADSNTFAITLNGQLEGLVQKSVHFDLARMAKELDAALGTTVADISKVNQELTTYKSALSDIMSRDDDKTVPLSSLSKDVQGTTQNDRTRIGRSFSPIRELLRKMESAPSAHDASMREALYASRRRAVDDAEALYQTWNNDVSSFLEFILREQKAEAERLEQLLVAEERRLKAEQERIAAEEAERLLAEQERLEREEQERLEDERRVEALRQQVERERIAAEEAEKARLAREHAEAEERQRQEEERLAEESRIQAEKDRIAAEEAEKERLQQERLAIEERLRLVEEELAEERRLQAEKDRIAAERLEQENAQKLLDEERRSQTENDRIAAERLERDSVEKQSADGLPSVAETRPGSGRGGQTGPRTEKVVKNGQEEGPQAGQRRGRGHEAHAGASSRKAATDHQRTRKDLPSKERTTSTGTSQQSVKARPLDEEDLFGLRVAPSASSSKTKEMSDLQAQILAFRKRLRSMSINETCRPRKSSTHLPSSDQLRKMTREFSSISSGVSLLPASAPDSSVDVELRSLRAELDASAELMKRVEKLARLADDIQKCDAALSDLLEHIDSFPASPKAVLSSSYKPLLETTPEEQLTARLSFTRSTIDTMASNFAGVSDDLRAVAEKKRIIQTWSELEEMAHDRLGGRRSRPPSTMSSRPSSGRNSSASVMNPRPTKKAGAYSNLSVSSTPSHKRLLVPGHPTPRRAVSGGSSEPQSRPLSRISTLSSNRAVSGPLGASIYNSTFASRQRTSSLSNSVSTPVRHPSATPRSRAQTAQHPRVSSPTVSEASSYTRSVRTHTRSSTSMSSWSRAPRNSLSSIAPMLRDLTPQKKPVAPRKTYVADPRNKLDVAVGDVVNKLPVGINVEGVAETWKDQSGKYWIGNQDPKLCFCRILRSQTVMVRVGGGWSELSKFIKDHFADSFRLLPDSPPRPGAQEEKWISSATLLETPAEVGSPPAPPRTPEPTVPFVPSFSLSTPTGQSPRSLNSPSNSPSAKGSPGLTPLQFIRRADMETILRPVTPSRPSSALRPRNTAAQAPTPARNSVWRP
ncbi:putative growth-arrest-specific protein [Lyophyllum shimeji]|uniref:Growth-arrest-specific protein n=1 Tax=Lyophyllum shimeji TaxID=47721 RepID=A0A9P3PDM0_LYOSH|nr:putative growth-arrest-specific protein [Lyophyllum shimeji]